jgi:UDP-GlcNAc:undecaprenyl-phosphate/decaprenyl-phosphate GlcNAc-1-phosphate transferase
VSEFSLISYVLIGLGSLAVTLVLTPLAMRLAHRLGILDQPSPTKFHQVPTPYLGGLAVAGAVLVAYFVPGGLRYQTLVLIGAALGVAAVGLLDDWRTLRPAPRLLSQVAAATALWLVHVRLSVSGIPLVDYVGTIFVVVAVTNAFNLLDNMDGLVPGVAAVASASFFVVAFWNGQALVALMAAALTGACLGFLPYNFGGARVFLGDTGALFVGFVLAAIAIKINLPNVPLLTRAVVPWLILTVPLFDMTLVVLSRVRGRRPVFRGATDHSSHRLVALGLTPRQAAYVTYLVGGFGGGLALLVLQVDSQALTAVVAGLALVIAVAVGWMLEHVVLGTTGTPQEAGPESRSGPT